MLQIVEGFPNVHHVFNGLINLCDQFVDEIYMYWIVYKKNLKFNYLHIFSNIAWYQRKGVQEISIVQAF